MQVCCGDFQVPLVNVIFFLQFDKVFFELPNDQPRASIWKIGAFISKFECPIWRTQKRSASKLLSNQQELE